jgi:DNA-binding LacI/PurR family transcriptional regulator/anti-anti-sigma regulatory factor
MSHTKPLRTIGVLSPYLGGVFTGSVLIGATRAARRHGVRLITAQESPRGIYQSRLAWDMVDGWIALLDADGLELLVQTGRPVATISCVAPGVPAVLPDNYGGMFAAVSHLIEHGHRRIAFIGRLSNSDVKQRFEGYVAALAARGVAFDEHLVFDVDNEVESGGTSGAHALIDAGMAYTAIAAGTDKNVYGVLEVLRQAGYRVPEDIAIVGFDDLPEAQMTDPPLTTVRQRFDLLGSAATELLLGQMSGRPVDSGPIYTATALITRRSCGCDHIQSPSLIGLPAITGAADWRGLLAQQLIWIVSYPFAPPPETPPEQFWPGQATIIEALDRAIAGRDPLAEAAIEDAWRQAIGLTLDLDALNTALDLIEQVSLDRLATAPRDDPAHARLAGALRLIRRELLRARVGHETAQVTHLDNVLYTNNEISTAMLGTVDTSAPTLSWLSHASASWGCLGLWVDPASQSELEVVSVYPSDGSVQLSVGSRVTPAAFPPIDLLPAPSRDESTIITLLPLRTSRRAWGLLAVEGLINIGIMSNSDPIVMWARMLGAALDSAALLAELNEQQDELRRQGATLQVAYDRERALSSTIREIGCPVIPLMTGVILIPLIGAIDSQRAEQIIRVGLDAVSRQRATDVLIDVTGVPLVDTQVAGALIQMARMVALLGARTMLVGVRPEIAQSIVGLGIDLTQIIACPTLAEALRLLRRAGGSAAPRLDGAATV